MSSPRTRAVRTTAGLAVGALALAAVAAAPGAASAAGTAAGTPVASAAAPNKTMVVRTEQQLRRAIVVANRREGADRIRVASFIKFDDSRRSSGAARFGDLDIVDDLKISGYRMINANDVSRVFDVRPGVKLVVANLRLRNGRAGVGESGGAVRNRGLTILRNVRAMDNVAAGDGASGGAAFNDGGRLVIERSWLLRNSAARAGGGVEANEGTTIIRKTRLNRNDAGSGPGNGGGLHLTGAGSVEVLGSVVSRNTAAAEGGGLWNSATGTMTVDRTELTLNAAAGDEADQGGGAVYNDGGSLSLTETRVLGNNATGISGSGGGILSVAGPLLVEQSAVSDNRAERAGGGIELVEGEVDVLGTRLIGNSTGPNPGNGGALHVTGSAGVLVAGSVVSSNIASAEGGGLWNNTGTMTVRRTELTGNTAGGDDATQGGGALFQNPGGTLNVLKSEIDGNAATGASGSGGGILNDQGTLNINKSSLDGNDAVRAGGAIETNIGVVEISGTDVTENSTGDNPGNGGGLHLTGAATVEWDGGDVTGNSAFSEGGGLWNSETGSITATRLDVAGNTAGDEGDDTYNDGGSFALNGDVIPPN